MYIIYAGEVGIILTHHRYQDKEKYLRPTRVSSTKDSSVMLESKTVKKAK